ncbi:MAG: 16S rRNA (adenine(1518)-N(6)/adenine(1519)-N(6))-dimethyltransferase RsmA [Muribaculaceae bacterium]|nr:16S rRNA (adenine(1518)-N(6)/adenine(1519)-N(6))-dimethyltransferase RsmA [Muribaculaceae bacterium]MDE6009421.1 16S rRNA (adenine(1518)-N(6)/adenine(1519)-N(6))-dimethyltransferase RsmA [Muribaculaceae bacterium]MDE6791571.1 16S rRNA (adenine(1518)-N(6)/adenine(1519)-N(6))-dimethyltransferase RsmA [Muribaculaceae bacterium]
MTQVKAKKALGQHFLTDLNVAKRIADTIERPELPDDAKRWGDLPVLEIGPGMGVLSQFLMQNGRNIKAVEIDTESVDYLRRVFPSLEVIEGDFLKMNLKDLFQGDFALIGNYPYNISSQIFFKVLDYKESIPVVAGMLQKEVAERICSKPGSKVYGILSVLLQAWYDCEYLFNVPPSVFSPPPKVTSGVIRLTRNSRKELGCDERLFKTVVKTAFGQRRKTLRNSLAGLIPPDSPIREDAIMGLRPERLGVEDFIRLTLAVKGN